MQINNDTLKKLSAMSDNDLTNFISSLAKSNNLSIPIPSQTDLARIRTALNGASRSDPSVMNVLNDITKSLKIDGQLPSKK